jgi:hypothetical protein
VTVETRNFSCILKVVTMHFNAAGSIVSAYTIIVTDEMEKYGISRGLCRVTIAMLAIAIPYQCVSNYGADIDCSVKSR